MSPRPRHIWSILTSVLLLCVLGGAGRAADSPPLIVAPLSSLEGLPQGTVMATVQDSQGFVWLGTEDGLVRFDGHEIHRYAYSQNTKAGLPGNFVNAIVEDASGDLWVGIKGAGVAHWHRSTDAFTTYRHDSTDPQSLASDAVRSLLIDSMGRIWIGTLNAGVDVLNPKTGRISHLRHDATAADSLIDDAVMTFMQDRSSDIWIGTNKGIDRWAFDGIKFHHALHAEDGHAALNGKKVTQVVADYSGAVWVGTDDAGLYLLDSAGHIQNTFSHDASAASLGSNDVHAILKDRTGRVWIGTADGLDLIDSKTMQFRHYRHDKSDRDSLSDSYIMSLYEDKSGLIWIGTRSGGVDRFNPHSWELGANRPGWLDGKLVTAFADAADGQIWVGSLGGGLVRVNSTTGEATNIDKILRSPNALGDRRVMSLHLDEHGTLWIGTVTTGIKRLGADGQIRSVPVARGDAHSLSAPGIMTIFQARNGSLWIGTHGGGANILDPATGLIRQLPYGAATAGAVSSENVTSFAEDALGNMWIGTEDGLDLASPDGTVMRVFRHDADNSATVPADVIYSLVTDASGQVWVATNGGGLGTINGSSVMPAAITFRSIGHSEGLSNDTIYSMLADKSSGLWMSGNSGLTRYDPKTREVRTYHREDGLQGEEFNFGAYFKTHDGRLCFGGTGGYNIFRPELLSQRRTPPRVVLTQMEILGVPATSTTPFWLLHHVALDYHASIVSFDFAALDFASPNRSRFEYKLAGLSDAWIPLDTQRRLTLTNLASGNYLLEIRAANADSVWSSQPLRLSIHKDAAPWSSTSAYTAYVVAALMILLAAVRSQRQKWRQAAAAHVLLESQVKLRTQELQETNQRLVVANEAKNNFLARMSHELRTPMNGVVGMTELLERTSLTAIQSRQTQTIKSSAQTLLQILNDLLDLSKAQAGKIQLESLPVDLTKLCEECASLFASTAETKGLEIVVCPMTGHEGQLMGDPLRIRQILMNLIANAVKFTETGEVVINCELDSLGPSSAVVRLSMSDTGIGLRPEAILKIFDPFTQADETTTRRFGGSGLGLSICAELVKLMGGSISVQSQLGVGSLFTVNVPLQVANVASTVWHPVLQGKRVRVITRRDAFEKSLTRYLTLLKPSSISVGGADSAGSDADDLTVWDVDSCGPALVAYLVHVPVRGPIVAVGTALAIEEHGLEESLPSKLIVSKPVYGDALRDAIAASMDPTSNGTATLGSAPRPMNSMNAHVLLVEDEPVNAEVARGYLAELGCTCVWVTDGTSAIARSSIERFDLILMDLNMPGLDGFAAAALIRERERPGRRVPIVALTATEAHDCRDRCLLAGMDEVLNKPYTFSQCTDLLRRFLEVEFPVGLPTESSISYSDPLSVDRAAVAALGAFDKRDNGGLLNRVIEAFKRSSREALEIIVQALSTEDYEAARAACHKIKSGAANVGAVGFADLSQELEYACVARDREVSRNLLQRLAASRVRLVESLEQIGLEESA